MRVVSPMPLQNGDTIGIASPSSPLKSKSIDKGINYLRDMGFKIKFGAHFKEENRFLAGSDENRAKDIMDFFIDPEVKAIIVSRGGQGSQRVLPLLDYHIIANNPKMLVGFSDTTALQLGIFKKTGLISYTGYTLTIPCNPLLETTFLSCLFNKSYSVQGGDIVHTGVTTGELIGGNLSLVTSLVGTPYQPDFKEKILLLEDVSTEPFNVDRMISHLDLAGIFDQVSGIVFGQFESCISKDDTEGTIDEVINDWASHFKVPCVKNFPYSHGVNNCVLPIGGLVTLDAPSRSLNINKRVTI
ncbi:S66 peptidase family protein [Legionella pneumophila]|uniref:Muramoyltetrapeptide carboxypeptidase n=1 Tax=Legionella pneumophila subsp. pascullei TaxID=91890 RepID=A0AAX2ISH4_LEGPN|nr:LD-carboxypeptidase [Legionella pneumophila]AMP88310.1 LD-carboxypeptidase [Legionella pneumophila subsp. pascullei]AMP91219.1 LD-carboxypeptidase [Legionella pneumophila subsp. pascullei]AMP94206.1 LD-carboxypeptidase [Legionella pneumophila subsp. pascullei]SQG88979.1 Muramoyltetrapeptide carboxypeptidase [Legionella pneumophila subsp. pascullei]VEH04029.1 Muramoyltetrapeptide carboxypeptidase [Legionella pneumophila subsp. pascullei]